MRRRGFTIVELLIVIAIMGILLVLAVVNLRTSQPNARDAQRQSDINAIAVQLESYYNSGDGGSTSTPGTTAGTYPSTAIIGNETSYLPDLNTQSLMAPGYTSSTFFAATNSSQTTTGVAPQPTLTSNQYVYQPLTQSGTLCTSSTTPCQKFNLYWMSEVSSTVQTVTSRNQ